MRRVSRWALGATVLVTAMLTVACASDPRPIAYDADGCAYCLMQISDPRFGAELITSKGKVYTFDSIECLLQFHRQASIAGDVRSVWVSDYRHPGTLISALSATYIQLGAGRSPMGRGLLAVASESDARLVANGDVTLKRWAELLADASTVGEARP